jgi:hypothetical protein
VNLNNWFKISDPIWQVAADQVIPAAGTLMVAPFLSSPWPLLNIFLETFRNPGYIQIGRYFTNTWFPSPGSTFGLMVRTDGGGSVVKWEIYDEHNVRYSRVSQDYSVSAANYTTSSPINNSCVRYISDRHLTLRYRPHLIIRSKTRQTKYV